MMQINKEVFATFRIGEEDMSVPPCLTFEPRDDDPVMMKFEESLCAVDERMESVRTLHRQLQSMDKACDSARQKVAEIAKNLIVSISEHEQRLLADIEVFRETQYKRCGTSRGQLDALVYDMKQEYDHLMLSSCGTSDFDLQLMDKCQAEASEVLKMLEKKLDILNIDTNAKVNNIVFSPIRCNTSFGTILPEDDNLLPVKSPAEKKKIVRSLSLAPNVLPNSSTGLHTKREEFNFCRRSLNSRNSSSSLSPTASCNSLAKPLTQNTDHSPASKPKSKLHRRLSHKVRHPPSPLPSPQPSIRIQLNLDKCLWKVNTEGSQLGQVNCPNDILFLDNGSVVVSDRDNLRLQIFDSHGKAYRNLAAGKVKPRRITLTNEGHIAVTDSQQNTVKIINLMGEVVKTWSNKKKVFKSPCGIAVTKKGQFIISDMEKHCLIVCNKDGKLSKPLPENSIEFYSPSYLALDGNDRVYVSDSWYQTLYVFDKNGKLDFEVTKTSPVCGGHIRYPNGLCVDNEGHIYTADWGNHTVSKFLPSGQFLEHVLTRENGILHPAGVAVHGGCLGVTEYSDEHSAVGVYDIRKPAGTIDDDS